MKRSVYIEYMFLNDDEHNDDRAEANHFVEEWSESNSSQREKSTVAQIEFVSGEVIGSDTF